MAYKIIEVLEVHYSRRLVEVDENMSAEDAYYQADNENAPEVSSRFGYTLDFEGECHSDILEQEYRDATTEEIEKGTTE